MSLLSNGNVGVGTTAPEGILDVRSNNGNVWIGKGGLTSLNVQGDVRIDSRSAGGTEYKLFTGETPPNPSYNIPWTSGSRPTPNISWWTGWLPDAANRLSCDTTFDYADCTAAAYPSDSPTYKYDLWTADEVPSGQTCPSANCYVIPHAYQYGKTTAPGGSLTAENINWRGSLQGDGTQINLKLNPNPRAPLKIKYDDSVPGEEGYYAVYAP